MSRFFFCFVAIVTLLACQGNKPPKGILPPLKMQNVLWDYISADVFTSDFIRRDSTKNLSVENVRLQKQIFLKHKVSKDEFYDSYRYYEDHPVEMQAMIDSMIAIKRRELIKVDTASLRKFSPGHGNLKAL